ncbi:putative transmembrane protein [bacterium BMS3Abin10]|nr:putative transmembrane protein [bacterium BMS3Abin10]
MIGFTIVMFGGVLLLLPGPGVLTILIGLAILGTEFVWARRLLKRFGDGANSIKNIIFNNNRESCPVKSQMEQRGKNRELRF